MGLVVLNIKIKHGDLIINGITANQEANTSRIDEIAIANIGQRLFYLSENENDVTRPLDGSFEWASEIITQGENTYGGYLGYVSHDYSDGDRKFTNNVPQLEIEFSGEGVLTIDFDKLQGSYATVIEINGVTHNNNSTVFYYDVHTDSPLIIKFLQLNKPFQPVEVTGIFGRIEEEFSDDDIVDYSFGRQSQNTDETPRYSVISQSGSVSLVNKYNLFTKIDEMDITEEEMECDVFIRGNKFGSYVLTGSQMADFDNIVSFNLTDKLFMTDSNEWNAVNVPFMKTDIYIIDFFEFIVARIYEVVQEEDEPVESYSARIKEHYTFFDENTHYIFENTFVPIPILNVKSIKEALNKICEITFCNMFPDFDGKLCVKFGEETADDIQNN